MDLPANTPDNTALCVDLDGTLLKTDLLHESTLVLLARNPLYLFLLPFWLLRGKAALKNEISARVELDPRHLPYDERVLAQLRNTSSRPRVLCTASDMRLARGISEHLGVFELVLASHGEINLSGSHKAEALVSQFGEKGFDYAGNHSVDLPVWRRARLAWVVNAPPSVARRAASECEIGGHLPRQGSTFRSWLKATRLHQWLKNLLVFLPLLASHRFFEAQAVANTVLAFFAFGLCASGVYVLNDLLDLAADRQHARKRQRPFASGALPVLHGAAVAPFLTLAGFAVAWSVGLAFTAVLICYYCLTLAYSLRLKRIVMLDVVLLAGLYTVRIIGGAAALDSLLSFWLLAFSMFIFLSLAMLKRYAELDALLADGKSKASGRGYEVEDLPLLQSMGVASGYLAVLVLALYINSPESLALYTRPQMLWLLCPVLLYWTSRTWVIAHRGEMDDDPVVFAVTDRQSLALLAISGLIVAGAI
jgi:4-hydroxybenzoate polyprenyltransferase/phosphoserine phosphatase